MTELHDRLDLLGAELTSGMVAPPVAAVRRRARRRRVGHAVGVVAIAAWGVWLITLPGLPPGHVAAPGVVDGAGNLAIPLAREGEFVIRVENPPPEMPAELRGPVACDARGAELRRFPIEEVRMVAHGDLPPLIFYEVMARPSDLPKSSPRLDAARPQPPTGILIQLFKRRDPGDSKVKGLTRVVLDGPSARLIRQGDVRVALVGTYGVVDHPLRGDATVRPGAGGRIAFSWWCPP